MSKEIHARKVVLIFNFLFCLTGIVFVVSGMVTKNHYDVYKLFVDERYYAQAMLLVFCGAFTFVITFFGLFGIFKRNYCLMLTFCGLLILLLILTLTSGIIGSVIYGHPYDAPLLGGKNTMDMYLKGDYVIQRDWDMLHQDFECCGSYGASNWVRLIVNSYNKSGVPLSCCDNYGKIGFANCSYTYDDIRDVYDYGEAVWDKGCFPLFGDYIDSFAYALSIVAYFFAVLQALGTLIAFLVAREVRT